MGIANEFTFGGVSTADYGLVVEGPGNYSAPTRAVEVINIPGRDGAFVLDKGYYENVPVEFNVVAKGATQADFDDVISAFRNAIVTQKGYIRLEELYHPGEYRMARYAGGFDEDPTFHGNGAIFKVKFDCKPQRYLTDGETAVSVDDGDTLTNPTLFEAHPLLMVEGYGKIILNGYPITIEDEPIGEIELRPASGFEATYRGEYQDKISMLEDGDPMTLENFSISLYIKTPLTSSNPYIKISNATLSRGANTIPNYVGIDSAVISDRERTKTIKYGEQVFTKQNSDVEYVDTWTLAITLQKADSTTDTWSRTFDIYIKNLRSGVLTIGRKNVHSFPSNYISTIRPSGLASAFIADSSQSILGHPTYIDCEIGEAYKEIGDQKIPLNKYIALGSKLPKLSAGENEIEYSGAITGLTIIPRWWKV